MFKSLLLGFLLEQLRMSTNTRRLFPTWNLIGTADQEVIPSYFPFPPQPNNTADLIIFDSKGQQVILGDSETSL